MLSAPEQKKPNLTLFIWRAREFFKNPFKNPIFNQFFRKVSSQTNFSKLTRRAAENVEQKNKNKNSDSAKPGPTDNSLGSLRIQRVNRDDEFFSTSTEVSLFKNHIELGFANSIFLFQEERGCFFIQRVEIDSATWSVLEEFSIFLRVITHWHELKVINNWMLFVCAIICSSINQPEFSYYLFNH